MAVADAGPHGGAARAGDHVRDAVCDVWLQRLGDAVGVAARSARTCSLLRKTTSVATAPGSSTPTRTRVLVTSCRSASVKRFIPGKLERDDGCCASGANDRP